MREKMIASLRMQGVQVDERPRAWIISVAKGAVRFEITVPLKVFEWFVSAYVDNTEMWKDSDEIYGDAQTTNLEGRYTSSVHAFIDRVLSSEIRYVESDIAYDHRRLQWRRGNGWSGVDLVENDNPA